MKPNTDIAAAITPVDIFLFLVNPRPIIGNFFDIAQSTTGKTKKELIIKRIPGQMAP